LVLFENLDMNDSINNNTIIIQYRIYREPTRLCRNNDTTFFYYFNIFFELMFDSSGRHIGKQTTHILIK